MGRAKAKPDKALEPILLGWCNPSCPPSSHARCRGGIYDRLREGWRPCRCDCHTAPPPVPVEPTPVEATPEAAPADPIEEGVEVFRTAWLEADAAGRQGERVSAGATWAVR